MSADDPLRCHHTTPVDGCTCDRRQPPSTWPRLDPDPPHYRAGIGRTGGVRPR